jgi:putative membrane protein
MNERAGPAGFAELRRNRLLFGLALAYALIWLILAVKPAHREDWLLENLLVVAALPVLVVLYRRRLLSNGSYVLLFLFLTLHAIGAHFTYTEMPLGNWLRDGLKLSRNHYDRVVHFAFGLLVARPIREVLTQAGGLRGTWSYVVPVHVVLAWSSFYEVVEGIVAHLVSPELGATFNGIQGDVWDAQKDMSLAMAGAIIGMATSAALQKAASLRGRPTNAPAAPNKVRHEEGTAR